MDFELLQRSIARQQLELLGGVLGSIEIGGTVHPNVLVLVDLGVQLPSDNGLTIEPRTVVSMLREEVGHVSKGNRITVNSVVYPVGEVLSDDGYIVSVFVRG